jgi:hypothetical protein
VQLVSFYVLIYSAIILIWPWEPSRFLLPLLPFYCLAFVVGLENLFTRLNLHNIRRQLLITVVTICLLAQFVSVGRLIITVRQTVDYTPATALVWNDLMEAYQWLRTKTNTSSILACAPTIEAHTFLYTQRQAVPLPAKLELLYKTQADYIIKVQDITFNGKTGLQQSEIDFRRLIRKFPQPDFLQIVHRNENVVIYKIDRAKIAQLLGGSLP